MNSLENRNVKPDTTNYNLKVAEWYKLHDVPLGDMSVLVS